jgi:hypothetical protein
MRLRTEDLKFLYPSLITGYRFLDHFCINNRQSRGSASVSVVGVNFALQNMQIHFTSP